MAHSWSLYRDPCAHLERQERIRIKHVHGCAQCRFRAGATYWGRSMCSIGKRPLDGRAYCHDWQEREDEQT